MELSQELLLRRRQEEKEARDLESMVQSVEQNLHLMTVRFLHRGTTSTTTATQTTGKTQNNMWRSINKQTLCVPVCVKQKRAVKAENSVSRLKVELQKLQVSLTF